MPKKDLSALLSMPNISDGNVGTIIRFYLGCAEGFAKDASGDNIGAFAATLIMRYDGQKERHLCTNNSLANIVKRSKQTARWKPGWERRLVIHRSRRWD